MTSCKLVHENLTAWIDGELPKAEALGVESHLDGCQTCAAEARALRSAISWQTEILPTKLLEAPVDVGALRLGLHRQMARLRQREEPVAPSWTWLVRPFALAASALAVAVLVIVWRSAEPQPLLVSLGVEPPPAEVVTRPDKFQYLDVIENLDVLEHFEAVQAVHLEDERADARRLWKG
jgi:anti-sigma factor RsiW